MKIAVISDIHANLEALEAIFDRLTKEQIDYFISLGDIVGYGANPNECVKLVKETCDVALMGNHDFAALGHLDISYFNPYAKKSVIWTGTILNEENRRFLEKLDMLIDKNGITYVHSTPHQASDWNYIFTVYDARLNFKFFNHQLCFIGHSHQPVFIVLSPHGEIYVHPSTNIDIQDGFRYIINVGSVGQPRDGNPDSSLVIYNTDNQNIQLIRVPYDIEKAQCKMNKAQIHPFLIERLAYGR